MTSRIVNRFTSSHRLACATVLIVRHLPVTAYGSCPLMPAASPLRARYGGDRMRAERRQSVPAELQSDSSIVRTPAGRAYRPLGGGHQ